MNNQLKKQQELKRLIQMTDGAQARVNNENEQKIQHHLNELSNHEAIHNSAINSIALAAIQHGGLPDDPVAFYAKVRSVAGVLSTDQLRRKTEGVREVVQHLNVRDLPAAIVWSARRAGVELLPEPKPTEDQEAPKLIVEH